MFANLGFAGAWFLGDSTTKTWEEMFKFCKEGEQTSSLKLWISKVSPYLSSFLYRNHCVDKKEFFPKWNDLAHQQVWQGHLKKAHEQGLTLMVLSAVHSYVLCRILPDSNKDFSTCEDRPNIVRQLVAAKKWIEQENSWVGLATTPAEARSLIAQGKLVIVFSVETENIFDHSDFEDEFEEYWNLGVRTLQIVHQFNNKLAGPAIHQRPLLLAQYIRNWLRFSKIEGFDSYTETYETKFGQRHVEKNKRGLTDFGKKIVQKMIDRGMMIDFAHMSEQTMKDTEVILKNNNNYPFYISHGHFRDVMDKEYGNYEKSSSVEILKDLKAVGGVFGMRTFETGTHSYFAEIQNNCPGSTLSFAQAYKFGQDLQGLNLAFGSDFNGFIAQIKPRFSMTDNSYCVPQKYPKLGMDFDYFGLGRIDQLAPMIQDIKNMGVDLHSLERSTENFISFWENSYRLRKF